MRFIVSSKRRWIVALVILIVASVVLITIFRALSPSHLPPEPPRVSLVSVDFDPKGQLVLQLTEGNEGSPGALVALDGEVFSEDLDDGQVSFGHTEAPLLSASKTQLIVMVPKVEPGPVQITVPINGTSVSVDFNVLPIRQPTVLPGTLARQYLDDLESILREALKTYQDPSVSQMPSPESLRRIVFVIDVSDSMTEEDLGAPRLEVAKEAVGDLLEVMDRSMEAVSTEFGIHSSFQMAMVSFSSATSTIVYLTHDTTDVKDAFEQLFIGGGTAIGEAIVEGAEVLEGEGGVLILLSDGADHSEPSFQVQPIDAVEQYATGKNVIIHTIGLGASGHEEFDEPLLMKIAELTGGEYHRAPTAEELRSAYSSIFIETLTASIVAEKRDEVLTDQGISIHEARERLKPPTEKFLSKIAEARVMLETLDDPALREIDGIIDASMILEFTSRLAEGGPQTGLTESNLAPCDDIGNRVATILLEGASSFAESAIPTPWGFALGKVISWGFGDLVKTLWGYYNDARVGLAWGKSIEEATITTANCINAIAALIKEAEF